MPKSGDAARVAEQALRSSQQPDSTEFSAGTQGGAGSGVVPGSPGAFGGAACAAAGDMYLRIQVAMELLWLHVLPLKAKPTTTPRTVGERPRGGLHGGQSGTAEDGGAGGAPSPCFTLEQLAEAAVAAVGASPGSGSGFGSSEDLVCAELGLSARGLAAGAAGAGGTPGGAGGAAAAGGGEYSAEGVEALNKFLEAYVSAVSDVKAKLVHQVMKKS